MYDALGQVQLESSTSHHGEQIFQLFDLHPGGPSSWIGEYVLILRAEAVKVREMISERRRIKRMRAMKSSESVLRPDQVPPSNIHTDSVSKDLWEVNQTLLS